VAFVELNDDSGVESFSEVFYRCKGNSQALGNNLKQFQVARRMGKRAHWCEAPGAVRFRLEIVVVVLNLRDLRQKKCMFEVTF
jgi:hypothetical protein